ncbi:hypothetical protein HDU90_008321 [Geranomyces variabilis]|nr:hypothetical protein HDU90_008321 [Geranomyces variabilis]
MVFAGATWDPDTNQVFVTNKSDVAVVRAAVVLHARVHRLPTTPRVVVSSARTGLTSAANRLQLSGPPRKKTRAGPSRPNAAVQADEAKADVAMSVHWVRTQLAKAKVAARLDSAFAASAGREADKLERWVEKHPNCTAADYQGQRAAFIALTSPPLNEVLDAIAEEEDLAATDALGKFTAAARFAFDKGMRDGTVAGTEAAALDMALAETEVYVAENWYLWEEDDYRQRQAQQPGPSCRELAAQAATQAMADVRMSVGWVEYHLANAEVSAKLTATFKPDAAEAVTKLRQWARLAFDKLLAQSTIRSGTRVAAFGDALAMEQADVANNAYVSEEDAAPRLRALRRLGNRVLGDIGLCVIVEMDASKRFAGPG